VDSLGFREAGLLREGELVRDAFPVGDESLLAKTTLLTSITSHEDRVYLSFYHSRADTIDRLQCSHLEDALAKLARILGATA